MTAVELHEEQRRPLATPDELAIYLQVPKATIYQWSSRGGPFPLFRVGRHLRARWSDVEACMTGRLPQAGSAHQAPVTTRAENSDAAGGATPTASSKRPTETA